MIKNGEIKCNILVASKAFDIPIYERLLTTIVLSDSHFSSKYYFHLITFSSHHLDEFTVKCGKIIIKFSVFSVQGSKVNPYSQVKNIFQTLMQFKLAHQKVIFLNT